MGERCQGKPTNYVAKAFHCIKAQQDRMLPLLDISQRLIVTHHIQCIFKLWAEQIASMFCLASFDILRFDRFCPFFKVHSYMYRLGGSS